MKEVTKMPIEPSLALDLLWRVFAALVLLSAICYFLFTLIVVRQVNLMTSVVMTQGGSTLRFLAIIYAGVSLGMVVLFLGWLI